MPDNPTNESERLREADDQVEADVGSLPGPDPSAAGSIVCITTNTGTYPSTPGVFYAVTPRVVLGPEVAGGTPVVTSNSTTFHALHRGATAPPVNTEVLVTYVPHRWIFRYDG